MVIDDEFIEEEEQEEEEEAFCSILNVVIDHGMQEPTTMEPEEWKKGQQQQVPVIRIFGSVLRPTSTNPPLQSACLHIHGAFPYLLARPRVAGPDGSLKRLSQKRTASSNEDFGHIDWDDREAVEAISNDLRDRLEDALQSFDLEAEKKLEGKQESNKQRPKLIRKITVVEGRGFYTYCPGPPAPFLRVEYYNPRLKWKVKMLLERGLEVPNRFHPDASLYDRENEVEDVLKFHCYEAHIPYTMQFFKDWNLSGMSYIHLRKVKIRNGLKNMQFIKFHRTDSTTYDEVLDEDDFVLPSNIPPSYLWSSLYSGDENDTLKARTEKVSSCDVEMDCRIEDIMNKQAVMKTMPEDQNEKDEIYWRAVPSLQEIWRQERIRMKALLGEEHELVSKPFSFTLNVKKNAPRSGARLATKGMKDLLNVTYGLEENFKRALSQILKRHTKFIQQMDDQANINRSQPQSFYTEDVLKRDNGIQLTPTANEAIAALGSLKAQTNNSPRAKDPFGLSDSTEDSPTQRLGNLKSSQSSATSLSQSQKYLSYSSSQDMHEMDTPLTQALDSTLYSQRVERGDTIIDNMGDKIDPETLVPYKTFAFGRNTCRAIFEVESDPADIRRVCGESAFSCCRDGHHSDLVERAKPRYYDTIYTGAYVDGILRKDESDDELDENEEDMEKDLMLTQIHDSDMVNKSTLDSLHQTQRMKGYQDLAQHFGTQVSTKNNVNESFQTGSYSSDDDSIEGTHFDTGKKLKAITEINVESSVESQGSASVESIMFSAPAEVTPRQKPPTRSQVTEDFNLSTLLPLVSLQSLPTWLGHAAKYSVHQLKYKEDCQGFYVRPVSMPPTRGKVIKWNRKRERSQGRSMEAPTAKREKVEKNLEIDGNSRKIVASANGATLKSSGDETDRNHFQEKVEEVQWESSQPWQLSASQLTQNDPGDGIVIPPSVEAQAPKSQRLPSDTMSSSEAQHSEEHALDGIGNQGGRIHIQGGGGLKTSQIKQTRTKERTRIGGKDNAFGLPSPISFMSVEIHIQCRTGASRLDAETSSQKRIAFTPNPTKDRVYGIVFIHGRDPGGGKSLEILSRGCLFVPLPTETMDSSMQRHRILSSIPRATMGTTTPLSVECFKRKGEQNPEKMMLTRFASIVRNKDPDMILSWDTQTAGLGYLIERAAILGDGDKGGFDLAILLGRTPRAKQASFLGTSFKDESSEKAAIDGTGERKWQGSGLGQDWDDKKGAGSVASSIVGRLVFAGWKIIAEEVKHANASYLPAVVAAVLNKRIPNPDNLTLSHWYASGNERWRALNHQLVRASSYMLLFDALDIIGRAGEAARLSGVEFSQSFPGIRGSQYKVEGVLLRALQSLRSDERGSKKGKTLASRETSRSSSDTKSPTQEPWKLRRQQKASLENRHYFFFSPSKEDTLQQEALEVTALTLEPQSKHYTDPVVVCDFTALYPSLIIAYNLCYSTLAGKLEYHSTRLEMQREGITTGKLGPFCYPERRTAVVLSDHMKSLIDESEEDRAYVAPTGAIFVSEDVVKGVLPQVLEEMLATRAMLKAAAKEYKRNVKTLSPAILRQLEARQLALKYVANVTYGYTSATFSGRCAMPLVADTIVACGRKTLGRAIDLANEWGREKGPWNGARVVYGDTDSLFVTLPSCSHKDGFRFGEQLCETIRDRSPPPVELKLEKVYVQSIMQTMKRYCGMKFESKHQKKPTFEAKGLETVRRDQCALTQKILRNALITLFQNGIGAVKEYLFRQWSLIYSGNLPVADFILTGRVRDKYRNGGEGPVQAVLANRIREADPGFKMLEKARLPYVIVSRSGTYRLKDCVVTPLELLEHWNAFTIHSGYYIEKHVNASLQRCLGLRPHEVDISVWYQECPKPRRRPHFWPVKSKNMITDWLGSGVCSFCGQKCQSAGRSRVSICQDCRRDPIRTSQMAFEMLSLNEQSANAIAKDCQKCNGCFESAETFASLRKTGDDNSNSKSLVFPLANCVCIDCPNTFSRHRLREQGIEAEATCQTLNLI